MTFQLKHWAVALLLSAGIHFGVSYLMQPGEEAMLIQGVEGGGEIVLVGETDYDAVAAGETEDFEDSEDASEVTPVTTDAVEAEDSEDVTPEDVTVESTVEPEEIETAEEQIDQPTETTEAIEPQEVAALSEAVVPTEEIQPVIEAPVPQPRPEVAKPVKKKKVVRQKKKSNRGDSGASNANSRRAESQGNQKRINAPAGNAAVSNYPGKVASRLRRSLRYPKSAVRGSGRGQARVAFTVTANGQAVSVRLVASSGSPVLDQAAIDAVRRASPFPSIPSEAGRSQWPFVVPIVFSR